jgi:RimJ/RimL family protein N-acetyltransferase
MSDNATPWPDQPGESGAVAEERLPRFETERLLLRQSDYDHLDALMEMDSDPEVMRFVREPIDEDNRQERLVSMIGKLDQDFGPGLGFWSVFDKAEPECFLGSVLLITLDGNPEVEIGWRFTREAWGKGYATEAAQAVLDYGFGTLALDPIVAVIKPGNHASIGVAERLGFRRDGTRTAYEIELPFYRLDRADWLAAREAG